MPRKKSSESPPSKALISPSVDALCGGGISLCVAMIAIAYGLLNKSGVETVFITVNAYLFTDLLINGPHFMASYRIVYSRTANFRLHPLVTILAPILAIGFLVYVYVWSISDDASGGAEVPSTQPGVMVVLNWLAPILLGWHYVGQSWGATACFAHIRGFRMTPTQRRLIRSGFYALFAYHVAWACKSMNLLETWFPQQQAGVYLTKSIMHLTRGTVLICFALGLIGFRMMSVDQKRGIPAVVWLPWVATFSWYVMVDLNPSLFFLLQVFHALQYLMFPARVEMNQYAESDHRPKKVRFHMLIYYAVLVLVGFVIFEWTQILEWTASSDVPKRYIYLATAIMMVVNIHHYFIDAVIWKIRDPEVRKSVFGHLEPA